MKIYKIKKIDTKLTTNKNLNKNIHFLMCADFFLLIELQKLHKSTNEKFIINNVNNKQQTPETIKHLFKFSFSIPL